MALYETLTRIDVMEPIAQKLVNRQMEIDPDDQRATIQGKSILPKPWILSGIDTERNCSIWFSFIFENYNLIHPGCRSCWKICYRPRNLDELFSIYKLQQEMKNEFIPGTEFHYHGKCGVERRAYVGNQGGYSSFWYNPLSCGLETARKIRLAVYDRISKKINPEPKVILKRGCTEMELSFPPSDNWEEYAKKYDWDEKLMLIEAVAPNYRKPLIEDYQMSVIHTQRLWIDHAEQYGDMCHMHYRDRAPRAPIMDYTGSIHNEKDFAVYKGIAYNESLRSRTESIGKNIVADLDE